MAEEKEKDNTFLYVAGIIVVTVGLVLMLKADETKHLKYQPDPTKEQLTKKMTHPGNKFTE